MSCRRILQGLAFAAFIFFLVSPGASAKYFSRVVIDPGHGGHDRGGRTGKVYEKHLALDTALRLENYLVASGYRVTMTRKSDTFISLPRRAALGRPFYVGLALCPCLRHVAHWGIPVISHGTLVPFRGEAVCGPL